MPQPHLTDAFDVIAPDEGTPVPLVVHTPHSGTRIPDAVRDGIILDDAALAREVLAITDHATDRIAEPAGELGAIRFVNRMSRLVVDPERFIDGTEPMEAVGMGPVYTRTTQGDPLREIGPDEREGLLRRWFHPYAQALASTVRSVLNRHGVCIILDLHSYPSQALPYELEPTQPRPEICVGTDPFHSPSSLVDLVTDACDGHGFDWRLDVPFTGTYVPSTYFQSEARVRSVMLEIRRDTYLDEHTGQVTPGLVAVQRLLADVVEQASSVAPPISSRDR